MTSHDLVRGSRPPRLTGRIGGALLFGGRLRGALLVGVPAVTVAVLGWRQRWVGDDGMVDTRAVRQILAGHGPVFNAGERAEATTGALWQWLLAVCSFASGKDPSVVAVWLGVLFTAAGFALAMAAARKAVRPLTAAPLLPVGMAVLLAVKADWDYASSGLESGLTTGWIALAWWYLVSARAAAAAGTARDRRSERRTARGAAFADSADTAAADSPGSAFPGPAAAYDAGPAYPGPAPAGSASAHGSPAGVGPELAGRRRVYENLAYAAPVHEDAAYETTVRLDLRYEPPAYQELTYDNPAPSRDRAPLGGGGPGGGPHSGGSVLPGYASALDAEAARTGRRRVRAAAVVIGLGPLIRPELGLVSVVFLIALLAVVRPRPLRAAGLLAAAVALPAAYEVFRAGYYGVLVPLPALPMAATGALWHRGLAYLTDFTGPYLLWVPLALLGVVVVQAPRRMLRPELLAPPVAGLLSWLYVCRAGGDVMHGRMLLPGLLLFMLPLCALPLNRLTGTAAAAVGVWAVLCALLCRPALSGGGPYPVLDEQRASAVSAAGPHAVTEMSHLRQVTPLLPAEITAGGAGKPVLLLQTPADGNRFVSLPLAARFRTRFAGSYALLGYNGIVTPLDATAVDPLGLAYPLAAHQEPGAGGTAGPPGHDKPIDPAWIVADFTDPGTPLPAGLDPGRVQAARHALACGPLAELQQSVRAPMTLHRFWRNLRGAWSRTAFRFPADPVQAERALCRG